MGIASSTMVTAGWVLILLYAAVILYFVIRGAGQTKEMDDYALGSVLFSPTAVGLSLAASITSAATFIINPGFVALYGFSGVIAMGLALPLATLVSLVLLTKGFRNYGANVKALSMADWMRKKYDSRRFRHLFRFSFLAPHHVYSFNLRWSGQGAFEHAKPARILHLAGYCHFHFWLHDVRRRQLHGVHQYNTGRADGNCGFYFAWLRL